MLTIAMSNLQVAGFLDNSTVNGEGFRSVLFLSGCHHNCPQCQNLDMQAFDYGDQVSSDEILKRILKNKPLIDGVTFSGGEPFEQSTFLIPLAKAIKALDLTLWCYTGYTYEGLLEMPEKKQLLKYIDVLIDGPFIVDLADPNLKYRGSSNQRVIQLQNGSLLNILSD